MKIENTNIIVGSEVDANFFGNGERMLAATLRLKGVKQAIIDGCEQMFKDEFPDINLVHITEMRITITEFYQYTGNTGRDPKDTDYTFSLAVEYDTDLPFNFYCADAVAWMDPHTRKIKEVTNNMLSKVKINADAETVFRGMYTEKYMPDVYG